MDPGCHAGDDVDGVDGIPRQSVLVDHSAEIASMIATASSARLGASGADQPNRALGCEPVETAERVEADEVGGVACARVIHLASNLITAARELATNVGEGCFVRAGPTKMPRALVPQMHIVFGVG